MRCRKATANVTQMQSWKRFIRDGAWGVCPEDIDEEDDRRPSMDMGDSFSCGNEPFECPPKDFKDDRDGLGEGGGICSTKIAVNWCVKLDLLRLANDPPR